MKKIISVALAALCLSAPALAETAAPAPYIFNLEYADAETAIGDALAKKGFGGMVGAVINGRKTTPVFSYNKPIEVEIRGLQADNSSKRWSANLLVLSEGAVVTAMPLSGRYSEMVELPVLKHSVRLGEVIKEDDVEVKRFAMEHNFNDFISDMASMIGKTPVRGVSPSRPIRSHELAEPAIAKKNDMVQMRYKSGAMEITASGQLLDNGAKGDMVTVRNLTSKKLVRAVVADEHTVDVAPAGQPAQQLSQLTGVDSYAK